MGRQRRFPQHNRDYADFRSRLVSARVDAGLSQQEVADRLGKPQSWVSKNESGERRVDAVELAKLAKVLKRPVGWFVEDVHCPGEETTQAGLRQTTKSQRRPASNA
jgi:transcriptional regulator with XRE-family HTH domain